MSAGEIGSHFNMTGATISYHLSILKKADLIWDSKVKNYVFYELNTSVVCAICIYGVNLGMNIDIGIYINILMV